jgi:hypothetical protein
VLYNIAAAVFCLVTLAIVFWITSRTQSKMEQAQYSLRVVPLMPVDGNAETIYDVDRIRQFYAEHPTG